MVGWIALTLCALGIVLWADAAERSRAGWIAKPIASAGFVGLAVSAGALETPAGRVALGALLLCWLGDVCLLGTSRRAFVAGLLAFAAGHLAFGVAFALIGTSPAWIGGGLAGLAGIAWIVLGWLWPSVPAPLRVPVAGYVVVITGMVALSLGTRAPALIVGASLFYLSDLCVARQRFVQRAAINRRIGLPLYYAGQLVLAASIPG